MKTSDPGAPMEENETDPSLSPSPPAAAADAALKREHHQLVDDSLHSWGYELLPIVGIGGSAGSLRPMQQFFTAMPEECGMAFVVVVHLAPSHDSALAEILQRSTAMRVFQVTGRIKVEVDCVYVIPPGSQILMVDGHLDVVPFEEPRGRRVVMDLFFRTLADTHGPHATAIILSGADGDGSVGIKRIKERGGLTIAQDPAEAEISQMPRSAIATGMIDLVLPIAEMPKRLIEYGLAEGRVQLPPETEPQREEKQPNEADLREVLTFLRMRTGHDFSYYKRATVLRRMARRMQVNNVTHFSDYLTFLRTHAAEAGSLLQDLLISVTNFFRDSATFQQLEATLPEILNHKAPGEQIRIWVAGCATGEEAYTLAMLLAEYIEPLDPRPQIQIFATDIDEAAIQIAREGKYSEIIAADVSEERLQKFFIHEHGHYRIKREIREMVLFALHDLLKDSPFSRLDLISCRNLLIYLNREAQVRAFEIFHFALLPTGRLLLGSSESAEEVRSLFNPVDKVHRFYSKRDTSRAAIPLLPGSHGRSQTLHPRLSGAIEGQLPLISAGISGRPLPLAMSDEWRNFSWDALHFKLLEGLVSPSLIVNSAYDVVHLSEGCGRFLQFTGGQTTMNLLRLVNPRIRVELRTALFRAAQTNSTVYIRGIRLEGESTPSALVEISIRPALEIAPDYLLVVFQEKTADSPPADHAAMPGGITQDLEKEIEHLRQQLRETVEQYEASTEELKASNEELQSMNEELRSATEELETSREELQSINEELTMVNYEFKLKIAELGLTNSDLQNLISSTHIATIFLDRQLCIKRYTPSAVTLFNLIVTDLGRPLSDLRHRLDYDAITQDAQHVLTHLTPTEREVGDSDGHWFLARMLPYRTIEDQIAGVVLTFVDITEIKSTQSALEESEGRLSTIFNQSAVGQSEIDSEGHFIRINDEICRILGRTHSQMLSSKVSDVTHPEDYIVSITAFQNVLQTGQSISIDKRYVRPDGTIVPASSSLSRLGDGIKRPFTVLAVTVDLTQRVEDAQYRERSRLDLLHALHETEKARASAEQADQIKNNFLAVLSHELRTPLTPVLMSVQSMIDEPDISDDLREMLAMIERNVMLETYLIDDLLDITRIARGKMEIIAQPMDLHEALNKAVAICQSEFEKKLQHFKVALTATDCIVNGDAIRLQQVIWNLLKNASKFTPREGTIAIATRNTPDQIIIEVTDNGIGIDEKVLPHIFNAFTQADPSITREFGGLGLGLAISLASIEAHQGTIQAASAGAGRGSIFTISLPLHEGSTSSGG